MCSLKGTDYQIWGRVFVGEYEFELIPKQLLVDVLFETYKTISLPGGGGGQSNPQHNAKKPQVGVC